MRIRISGPAEVHPDDGGRVAERLAIDELDGAESGELCGDYLDGEFADLGVTGGAIQLTYDAAEGRFRAATEYASPVELGSEQLDRLVQETAGQWSDGIGEACFDDLAERLGVAIVLSPPDRVEQIDDGRTAGQAGTALARAAREGDLATLRAHLAAGADLEARLQGYTPLHLAILYGRADAALDLIAWGADINARDPQGHDPLLLTALSNSTGDAEAVRVAGALLGRGAAVHGPWGAAADASRGEYTPLSLAEARNKGDLAALLRGFGAAPSP